MESTLQSAKQSKDVALKMLKLNLGIELSSNITLTDSLSGIIEEIEIDGINYNCKKFTFNASSNPKDKGPFPEYTLWYHNDELLKMEFQNPKDKKTITIIRTDLKK